MSHVNIEERESEAELVYPLPLLFEENPKYKCGCGGVRQIKKKKVRSEKSGRGQSTVGHD